jgi:hypothetical protein
MVLVLAGFLNLAVMLRKLQVASRCAGKRPTARFFSNISRRPSHWEDAGFSTFIQGTLSRSVTGSSLRADPDNKEMAVPREGETGP